MGDSAAGRDSSAATLSVIVTSPDASETLRLCLAALVAQQPDDIIVADSSADDPTEAIGRAFPGVRVLHFTEPRLPPALRWAAMRHARGGIVAALESRTIPAPDWCAVLADAHRRAPEAPAIGGPVALKPDASAADWGLYFSEYVRFAPPIDEGSAREISGANLSYKREALDASQGDLDAGTWELFIHNRWVSAGQLLYLSAATVVFHNGMTIGDALRMRYRYGRSYAAARCATISRVYRACCIAGSPVLPVMLTWRAGLTARRKGLIGPFLRALAWTLVFNAAWSWGELVGYVRGR